MAATVKADLIRELAKAKDDRERAALRAELACARNERWRADLLSRALMLQMQDAESISLASLFQIGLLSERAFHAFSHLLDTMALVDGSYYVNFQGSYLTSIPNCQLGQDLTYGHILPLL